MSDRYSRLFSLPENLYSNGSPVIISAGALLKDTQTQKVLAQLKIRNINDKKIKAAKVQIQPFDIGGSTIGDIVYFQYLDLNVFRNADFGSKTPIVFSDNNIRSFSVAVTEIIFEDNSSWISTNNDWNALPKPQLLEEIIRDGEFLKQLKIEYGEECQYKPYCIDDIWICSCGVVNSTFEPTCNICRAAYNILDRDNIERLKEKRDIRISEERKRELQLKAQKKAKAKRNKTISVISFVCILAICIAVVSINKANEKKEVYDNAVALVTQGEFDKALSIFEELGDYKDCPQKITETLALQTEDDYKKAIDAYEKEQYLDAIEIFEELGNYKDSAQYIDCALEKQEIQRQLNTITMMMGEPEGIPAAYEKLMDLEFENEKTIYLKNLLELILPYHENRYTGYYTYKGEKHDWYLYPEFYYDNNELYCKVTSEGWFLVYGSSNYQPFQQSQVQITSSGDIQLVDKYDDWKITLNFNGDKLEYIDDFNNGSDIETIIFSKK